MSFKRIHHFYTCVRSASKCESRYLTLRPLSSLCMKNFAPFAPLYSEPLKLHIDMSSANLDPVRNRNVLCNSCRYKIQKAIISFTSNSKLPLTNIVYKVKKAINSVDSFRFDFYPSQQIFQDILWKYDRIRQFEYV